MTESQAQKLHLTINQIESLNIAFTSITDYGSQKTHDINWYYVIMVKSQS